jgi:hypothetical protein
MPLRKEIVYPIFLECCQYTEDTFWESIFTDLAYGKPPYGTYISKGFLCCTHKKKDFSYKIEKKDAKKIYQEVYSILNKKLGILSHKDKVSKRKLFNEMEKSLKSELDSWNNIKKKNTRELMIELYVTRMKEKHSLTIKQSRYLLSILFTALIFKVIKSSDIVYENGKVQSISGIDFLNKKIIIEKDLYDLEISFSEEIVNNKKLMSETWNKFIKELEKLSGQ